MYSFGPTNVHVCTGYYKQVAFLHVHSEHYRLVPLHTVHVGCVPQQHKLQGHCNYAAYIMQPPKKHSRLPDPVHTMYMYMCIQYVKYKK